MSAKKLVVMDGGMGLLLLLRGVPRSEKMWSAFSLHEPKFHPMVLNSHKEFIFSGAQTITTNNYAVQPTYYKGTFGELWRDKMEMHTRISGELARRAVEETNKDVLVCGCLPPLVESYRPDLTSPFLENQWDFAVECYANIVRTLSPFVDVFLAETMTSVKEAECAVEGILQSGEKQPIWISYAAALRDTTLNTNTSLAEKFAKKTLDINAATNNRVELLGYNCSGPEDVNMCFESLTEPTRKALDEAGIPLGGYANTTVKEALTGFDMKERDSVKMRKDLPPEEYAAACVEWLPLGATYLGGCCGTTPDHIKALVEALEARQNK